MSVRANLGRSGCAALAMLLLAGCAGMGSHPAQDPLAHFYQVDEGLYRGAQPTAEGFRRLKALGVKTVVSLRAYGHEARSRGDERHFVESLGMRWASLPMRMYWRPSEPQVQEFLAIALDPDQQPVFVHCQHGEDRTGALVAVYRVVKQGWAPDRAYTEARALGLAGWNPFIRRLILHDTERPDMRTALSSP